MAKLSTVLAAFEGGASIRRTSFLGVGFNQGKVTNEPAHTEVVDIPARVRYEQDGSLSIYQISVADMVADDWVVVV